MSDQEKKSGGGADSSVVLVEQSAAGRHKQAFHPIDIKDDAPKELHHKRSKAPAVPSVTEELKDGTNAESKDRKELERAMSSEKEKHYASKKLSSSTKRRSSSPEAITLAPMAPVAVDMKKSLPTTPSQPIPAHISVTEVGSDLSLAKDRTEKKDDDDSITGEIAEMRTPEVAKASEWSDEEEAGGLPRSESRASRVSRAVRQLFCCGVALESPSEHNMSPRTQHDII